MRQEARPAVGRRRATCAMPDYMEDVVATFSHLARQSSHVNQRSGVSVRLSVSNVEVLAANALRRVAAGGRAEVVPRVSDLEALAASTSGKIEIETLEEGREGQIVENMLKGAVLTVFKERLSPEQPPRRRHRLRRGRRGPHRRGRAVGPGGRAGRPASRRCGSRSRA